MKEMIAKRISRILIALLAVIAVSCFVMQDGMQAHADEIRTFPIWIGHLQVTEENAEDVLNDGGTVKFIAESNTLVLDNANLIAQTPGEEYKEYDYPVAIYARDIDLTINFKGENRIIGVPRLHSYGIVLDTTTKDLAITGENNATLTFSSIDENAIHAGAKLTITGGEINATSKNSEAICADGSMTISGGDITAISEDDNAIYVGSDDIDSGYLEFTGGNVTAKTESDFDLAAIVANDRVLIGKDVESLEAYSKNYAAIIAVEGLTVRRNIAYPAGGHHSEYSYYWTIGTGEGEDFTPAKHVFIGDPYPVWVGGTQINKVNKDDVLGDGTVSYEPKYRTLTLNNADISEYYKPANSDPGNGSSAESVYQSAIYAEDISLTIDLIGENKITGTSADSAAELSNGIYLKKNDYGDCTLEIRDMNDGRLTIKDVSYAIRSEDFLRLENVRLSIDCNDKKADNYKVCGLSSIKKTTVSGGEIIIKSIGFGVSCGGLEVQEALLDANTEQGVREAIITTTDSLESGNIEINGGTVKAVSKINVPAMYVYAASGSISISDDLMIVIPRGGKISTDGKGIANADGTVPVSTVEIAPAIYTVTFYDGQGKVLKKEQVLKGNSATPPEVPPREGYVFLGWEGDYENVTSDQDIYASWQAQTSIEDAKVVLTATSYTYDGKAKKPGIKTIDGQTLVEGTDYTAEWSSDSPKDVGNYTVTITGTGKYTGTTSASYKINPKRATIKTPKKARKALIAKWARQSSKMSKTRITGYEVQVALNKKFTKGKKTVKAKGYKKTSCKVSKLKGGKKYYVRVRTYKTIGKTKLCSKWSSIKTVKTKK